VAAAAVRPLLFAIALAIGAREAVGAYSVYVAPARSLTVSGDITAICGVSTLGCTDITAVALRTRCAWRGTAWAADAFVVFAPVLHLPSAAGPGETHRLMAHELEHVRDFHRFAEVYARSLSRQRFDSAEDCRALTLREEAAFGARMAAVGRESVARRR
jgi:hypothetical protein